MQISLVARLNLEPCREANSGKYIFSFTKLTEYNVTIVQAMTTWHPYLFLFIMFNVQIKTLASSCFALHDATLTTQLDGLHFVYSSDVGLLRCWYLLAAVNISVWMYKHDLHSFSYIYDIFTVKM